MIKGGHGGENTNKKGLAFEGKADIVTFFNSLEYYKTEPWIQIHARFAHKLFYKEKIVGYIFKKDSIYKFLKKEYGYEANHVLSKKLLPDNSIFILSNNTFFVIEIKHQSGPGSVDEKLQTCDFKKKQWMKLLAKTNWKVEYWYLLNNWFKRKEYWDSLNYIYSVGCEYFFNSIPLIKLGLEKGND